MLTDSDILLRLTDIEDSTVERKTKSDNRDWIKAAVALSNSLPLGEPGILFVGVYDDGRIEDTPKEAFESLQRKVSRELSNIYPPISPQLLVREKDGKHFLAVIVYGSAGRPHFAGKAYIRNGTQTQEASEAQFQELIATRTSKTAEILKWKDREITVDVLNTEELRSRGRLAESRRKTVRGCDQFLVTLQDSTTQQLESIPLRRVEISYDHGRSCLKFELYPL
jgi:predicted HTH transcriptional regulator